ncbi:MAG: hypothetical protein WBR18_15435 [Anaerolineales bacterium]
MHKRIRSHSWKRPFAAISLALAVLAIASIRSPWIDRASAQGSVISAPAVELHLLRLPSVVPRITGNVQWFARVGLKPAVDPGAVFSYVVWLHVPDDWELRWARTYSFSGDFSNGNLVKQYNGALEYIGTTYECISGGPANVGDKWSAWSSPHELLPESTGDVVSDYLANEVNLRGGMWAPAGAETGLHDDFRMALGIFFDSNGDDWPDTYTCDSTFFRSMTLVP